jgi:ABC-type dipeptide/oligopeptide/nickel transport system permease component
MHQYVARRLLLFVPSLLGASILIFVLLRLVPGDIAEIIVYQAGAESSSVQQKRVQEIRTELGLDRPIAVQYIAWLGNALRGDFGQSYIQQRPVTEILRERFPRSLELAFLTLVVAVMWAVPLGVISAVRQNSWGDYLVRLVSISGLSLPIFFTGVLILWALVRFFRWLPPLEFVSFFDDPAENLKQLVWPTLFSLVYTTDAGSNWGKWSDKKVDQLTEQGLKETNRDKRKQIYWELQRYLLSGAPSAIPVAWVEGYHFVDKRVRGYKFAPTVYDNNTFMKVWLAP